MIKKAFITGVSGQDGSLLAEFLLSKNYKVYGLLREKSNLINLEKIINNEEKGIIKNEEFKFLIINS